VRLLGGGGVLLLLLLLLLRRERLAVDAPQAPHLPLREQLPVLLAKRPRVA